ncbi:auxin-independent growth promoter-like protein [Medicago truncatula]|uniref:O-fucosyltransferase family protein n=1 Tax=Medicago truncatula TaxID=3880 RepID=G7J3Z2_MEDTR|nr:auxin-independent growth promoter-like protein [Medicago truncatula]
MSTPRVRGRKSIINLGEFSVLPKGSMQKRRKVSLAILIRRFLGAIILSITITCFFFVHVHVSTSPTDPNNFNEKIHMFRNLQSWTREFVPPHSSKAPPSAPKLNDSSGDPDYEKLWKPPPNHGFLPCTKPTPNYTTPENSQGYLLVHTNGGLNQMRAGICDMVAIARIINATLVIPELDKKSFWQDSSIFSDIFDEKRFISSLADDIKIINKLPKELANAPKMVKQFKSWSGMDYYQNEIAALWDNFKVIQASKSDSRLANNHLPQDIQKLRCRACYEALRFSPRIEQMGKILVERMRSYGPYITLHLRYEKDMLAFSGCTHDLSTSEAKELRIIRENTTYWKRKHIDPKEERAKGYCPLTPKEVGIFLSALGYPAKTPIYIAAGEIYGGESHMTELRSRYPFLMSKEKLASIEELEPFSNHASQMAALDYIVSVESDVFVHSYPGNMARAVEGHRRFLGRGRTISPDRKALVRLFDKLAIGSITEGEQLSKKVNDLHKGRVGLLRKRKGPIPGTKGVDRFRSEETFYANPLPDCLCRKESPPTV